MTGKLVRNGCVVDCWSSSASYIALMVMRRRSLAESNVARRGERLPLRADVDFRRAGDHRYRVNILDFSPEGCRIELPERVLPNETIWISLPGLASLQARVRWVKDWVAGVEFDRPLHPSVFTHVSERMREIR